MKSNDDSAPYFAAFLVSKKKNASECSLGSANPNIAIPACSIYHVVFHEQTRITGSSGLAGSTLCWIQSFGRGGMACSEPSCDVRRRGIIAAWGVLTTPLLLPVQFLTSSKSYASPIRCRLVHLYTDQCSKCLGPGLPHLLST